MADRNSIIEKDMQRSLRSLAAETSGAHKAGIKLSKDHTAALEDMKGARPTWWSPIQPLNT
jgi:hypothetical protein